MARSTRRLAVAPIAVLVIAGLVQLPTSAPVQASAGSARPTDRTVSMPALLPRGAEDLGHEPGRTPISLEFALVPRSPTELESFVAAVSTPGSPTYRHYLSKGQFSARFGPTSATLRRVITTLRSLSLTHLRLASNHLLVTARTTVGIAQTALSTSIDRFALPSGRAVFANVSSAKVPAGIAGDLVGVFGLSDAAGLSATGGALRPRGRARASVREGGSGAGPVPCDDAALSGAATSQVLATAYGINGLYRLGDLGQGQSIALFEAAAYSSGDVAVYQSCYKTHVAIQVIHTDGGDPIGAGTLEATADVEDLVGLAPRARILVYETPNDFSDWLVQWSTAVADDTANVLSSSWFGCEAIEPTGYAAAEDTEFEQAAVQGQTVLAATGDYGSAACKQFTGMDELSVNDPSSSPYVTAVGGTEWTTTAPRGGERTWNDPSTGSSGGGLSSLWAMPSWQQGRGIVNRYSSGVPCHSTPDDCRETPDVSALAGAPFYSFFCNTGDCSNVGGWGWFYGTSFASPLWAASVALTDESCASEPPVGFLNPALYAIASSPLGGLYDITSGDTDFTKANHGDYPATVGYDLATGLGTPRWTTGTPAMGLAGLLCLGPKLVPLQQTTVIARPTGAATNPGAALNATACTTVAHCAAVGTFTDSDARTEAMAVSEGGGSWRTPVEVAAPVNAASDPAATLKGIACTSAGNCVGVGGYTDDSSDAQALVAEEGSGAWSEAVEVTAPTNASSDPLATLDAVSCASVGNCVAVGSYEDDADHGQMMEATETSGVWAEAVEVAAPAAAASDPVASLDGVSCTSTSCTAAGTFTTSLGASEPLVAEESLGSWTPAAISTPSNAASDPDGVLDAVACTTTGNCVAVGSYGTASAQTEPMEATELNGVWARGVAVVVPSNAGVDPAGSLLSVACVATGRCVAVGDYVDGAGARQAMVTSDDERAWSHAASVAAPAGSAPNPDASLTGVVCPSIGLCVGVGAVTTSAGDVVAMAARASLPTVTKLSAGRGPTSGGTPIYLIGSNLQGVVSVQFGAARAKVDGLVVPAELEVTPPRGAGTVIVTVSTVWGTSVRTTEARYTYVRPRR